MSISGKTAIITGASHGIGLAIARRFANEGVKLLLADIDDDTAKQVISDLGSKTKVHYCHTDVSKKSDIDNLVTEAEKFLGDVDILVNSAGIALGGDLLDLPLEDFEKVLSINLTGTFLSCQAIARHMVKRVESGGPAGCIINLSSINAKLAIPTQVPYTISKGGVRQLTNVFAQSLASYGIRVNAIGPGSIDTRMLSSVNSSPEAMHRVMQRTPMGRLGESDEMAGIAVFLSSSDSSYITGQTIYADGGRLGLAYTVDPTS